MVGVVPGEQRGGIETDGACQGPDVTARVDVATAGGEVVLLDGVDDGDADPGGVADVVDSQPGVDACLPQGTADRELLGLAVVFERTLVFGELPSGELPMDTGAPFERVATCAGGSV